MIDPIALSIGPFDIYWYGIVYALGFLFCYWFTLRYSKFIGTSKENLEDILFYTMIFGLIGGRIAHILFYDLGYFLSNPQDIIRVDKGGMSIHGGILGGLLAIIYSCRKREINLLKFLDVLVIPLSLAMAFGRITNYINQELVGRVTSSSFGVVFSSFDEELRHPSQLYESFKNLIVFQILLYLKFFKKLKSGIITAYFLILYNGLRFVINFTREPEVIVGFLSMSQTLSLIFMVAGFVMLFKLDSKK